MKLTPKQKLLASRIKFVQSLAQKLKTGFSFGSVKTQRDILLPFYSEGELEYAYSNSQLDSPTKFNDIKSLEEKLIWNIQHEDQKSEDKVGEEHEYEGYTYKPYRLEQDNGINKTEANSVDQRKMYKDKQEASTDDNTSKIDWDTFFTSPNQKASLRGEHQRSTSRQIYSKFLFEKRRAILLEGGAGNGKTFVAGAVLRKLIDHESFLKDCISPWPILWITRASIVEQTSRVCRDDFGLCPHTECIVINIEQLRAKFGGYMVEDKTAVISGEEHIIWKWKPRFHPKVFVIDECQLAKNEDSTQSKIIQAISDIEDEVCILMMSATPWTRVIEAKYFAVNTKMEIKI